MKCESCGAPLEQGMERCPYCGTLVPVDEKLLEEKAKRERKRKLENLPQMKYVPGAMLAVLYVFTAGLYAVYWYAMRMKDLNNLNLSSDNKSLKVPAWLVAVFALSFIAMFMLSNSQGDYSAGMADIDTEANIFQDYFNYALAVVILTSGWLAFKVRAILQSYAANYLDSTVALQTVAPSGVMLCLFGAAYLQMQINKMISMEILAPKI
ncbi:MAG: zinc ribbon domain-containing protein [Synergistaceae bacterium]|nr:zinc ribbon domain-containing protein [Synergistaceae bacterium]